MLFLRISIFGLTNPQHGALCGFGSPRSQILGLLFAFVLLILLSWCVVYSDISAERYNFIANDINYIILQEEQLCVVNDHSQGSICTSVIHWFFDLGTYSFIISEHKKNKRKSGK